MKTTILDYVLGSVASVFVLGTSAAASFFGVHPATTRFLGDYYVVADCVCFLLLFGLIAGFLLRALLALRPLGLGVFAMTSSEFTYWKLLVMITDVGRGALLPFTPLFVRPLVAWLYGAKVGADVALGGTIADPFMIEIGDNVVLGNGSQLCGNFTADGKLTVGRVKVGNGATVGINAVIFPNVEIGAGAAVTLNSVVMPGTTIPAGETWRGNPARKWQ